MPTPTLPVWTALWLSLALGGVLGALWLQARRGELLAWAAGFGLFALRLGLGLGALDAGMADTHGWLGHLLAAAALGMIALGTFISSGRRPAVTRWSRDPKTITRVALLIALFIVFPTLALRALAFTLVWIASVHLLREQRSAPRWTLAVGMVLSAAIGLLSFVTALRPDQFVGAFALAVIPWIIIAAGVLLVHFERVQRGLEAGEARTRTLARHAGVGVALVDSTGRIAWVNDRLAQLTGSAPSLWVGREILDVMDETSHQRWAEQTADMDDYTGEVTVALKGGDGQLLPVKMSRTPLGDDREQGAGALLFVRGPHDATQAGPLLQERERLLGELDRARRLGEMGEKAGGVVHDVNNLLQAILTCSDGVLRAGARGELDREGMETIAEAARRGGKISRGLLDGDPSTGEQPAPIDLNGEVARLAGRLERILPDGITLRLDLCPGPLAIKGDASEVDQLVMNLALNARDAMNGDGTLQLSTTLAADGSTTLTVTDSGPGIDSETATTLFDPLVTSKSSGHGTGLGLAMCRAIARRQGAEITAANVTPPATGARFTVEWPSTFAPTAHRATPPTILLMDNDDRVRARAGRALKLSGFRVHTAPDGEQGLSLYHSHLSEIDLVLVDLVMPGMGGAACLRAILADNPEARVMVTADQFCPETAAGALAAGACNVLSKPCDDETLVATVRDALQADESTPDHAQNAG